MGSESLSELMARNENRVRAILNILIESPYFYKTDDHHRDLFPFLLRHRTLFREFFELYFGWDLIIDSGQKCARVYKKRWYNTAISESNRFSLRLTRRDETLAFMLLLEFYELQLDEQNVSSEDRENLRFYFSDLLVYVKRRLHEEYPENIESYSEEAVRKILRQLLPELLQFRLLKEVEPPDGENISAEKMIFEALPALSHYNASELSFPIFNAVESDSDKVADSTRNTDESLLEAEDLDVEDDRRVEE